MSDFNPKNIPTLDDVIEDEAIDEATPISATDGNDNSIDLFKDEETNVSFNTDAETDNLNDSLDKKDSNGNSSPHIAPYTFEETYDDLVDFNPITPIQALDVEKIIKSVVKQMMPDLEQQLRFLIQQALEKQIPPELIKSPKNDTDDS